MQLKGFGKSVSRRPANLGYPKPYVSFQLKVVGNVVYYFSLWKRHYNQMFICFLIMTILGCL